jgi:lincosamide nucleotidyltransferase A/C/D/E
MNSEAVVDLYKSLEKIGINVWLDGGWGVDALLKKQTRSHSDVDIVVEEKHKESLNKYLKGTRGYKDVLRDDTSDWCYVLGNNDETIDVHIININKEGRGIYGPAENNVYYPDYSLTCTGSINGIEVRCLSPEYQIESHSGYELKEKDYQDVKNLCEAFKIDLPEEYIKRFQ